MSHRLQESPILLMYNLIGCRRGSIPLPDSHQKPNKMTTIELSDSYKELVREHVLNAIDDTSINQRGWNDSDLTDIFNIVDEIAERNFFDTYEDRISICDILHVASTLDIKIRSITQLNLAIALYKADKSSDNWTAVIEDALYQSDDAYPKE